MRVIATRARTTAALAWVCAIVSATAVPSTGCFSSTSGGSGRDAAASSDATADTSAPDRFVPDSASVGPDARPDHGAADASGDVLSEAGAGEGSLEAGPADAQTDAAPVDAAPEAAASTEAGPEGGDAAEDATDSGDAPSEAGVCSPVGTWTGTYSCPSMNGDTFAWVISADGTAVGTIDDAATVDETWSLSGETLSIADTGGSGCTGSQVGTYTVTFSASCAQMTLTEIADPCTGRGTCVNGLVVTLH
jgi:hypothetical protein